MSLSVWGRNHTLQDCNQVPLKAKIKLHIKPLWLVFFPAVFDHHSAGPLAERWFPEVETGTSLPEAVGLGWGVVLLLF